MKEELTSVELQYGEVTSNVTPKKHKRKGKKKHKQPIGFYQRGSTHDNRTER